MSTTASRTRKAITAAARVISLKHCGCVASHGKPCAGCEDLAVAVLAAAGTVKSSTASTCADCQGAVYRDENGTAGQYCTRTGCGRSHLLTDAYLTGRYTWAVDYPNGTAYMPGPTDPATDAPELVMGHPTRRVYLTDLRSQMTGQELAELATSALRDDVDPEGATADARCGASHKTYLYGRLSCEQANGHSGGHRDLYDGTWTD